MDGRKGEVLLEALGFLARRLRGCDRLSIIAFNHHAKVVTGLRRMDLAGKESVAGAISSSWALRPAGGTDIVAGVQLACSVLGRRRQSNTITSLLLFTDGQDDDAYVLCGGSDQACSRPSPPQARPASGRPPVQAGTLREILPPRIALHCFGLGDDCDAKLLGALAETVPHSTFTFIEAAAHVPAAFGCCLGLCVYQPPSLSPATSTTEASLR